MVLPDPDNLDDIPQDPRNALTPAKVLLGKMLFCSPSFARDAEREEGMLTYSCASCHVPVADFRAGIPQGIGEGGLGFGFRGEGRHHASTYTEEEFDVQPIITPTIVNVAFIPNVLWDGKLGYDEHNAGTEQLWTEIPQSVNQLGYEGTETQAIAGLGVHRLTINETIVTELGYQDLFDQAFPDFSAAERYSPETAGLAIAAYERTVLSNEAPWQRYLRGERSALSDVEKRGAIVFFGKGDCVNCHYGPALTDNEFHALGTSDLFEFRGATPIFKADADSGANRGRGGFTNRAEDMFKFKTPPLYNLGVFQFHGAQSASTTETVAYFDAGVPANPRVPSAQLSPLFQPLGLTEIEKSELVAFLENGLRDPNLIRYQPTELIEGACFPNADPLSRQQLGCN